MSSLSLTFVKKRLTSGFIFINNSYLRERENVKFKEETVA
jgi:hypothetical protein